MRRHDWIVDMLSDLQDFTMVNGLPDLAASVEVALAAARRETPVVEGKASTDHRAARRERKH